MRSPFYNRYCRSNPAGAIAAQGMNLAGREVKEMAENTYNVGIHCRLSNDDERDGESVSIENQELLCKGWSHHLIHMTAIRLWKNGTL